MIVNLTITALAPLAFSERKPGEQYRESLPFVPGGALFGALGAALFERPDAPRPSSERFATIRCRNAYPLLHEARQLPLQPRPLPITAMRPKGEDKRPPRDTLAERVCWERQQPRALIYAPTAPDGRPWEGAGKQFYILAPTAPDGRLWEGAGEQFYILDGAGFATHTVSQRVLTRVAINRRTGTAEDQRLYSPLVLSEVDAEQRPTLFRGTAVLPDGDTDALEALRQIRHVGGRLSSGLGRVQIEAQQGQAEDAAAVQRRVIDLTSRFQQQARRYRDLRGEEWDIPDETIFTLNLLSDAFLVEHGWLPTYHITPDMLKELTGIEAELVRSFTGTLVQGGWNTLWQRPKPTVAGVSMGSLFVFQARRRLTPDDYTALAQLQTDGIGERRQEGYGHVRICDEFHTWRKP